MSRLYFSSPDGAQAELWGPERGWLGQICSQVAESRMGLESADMQARWLRFFQSGHYVHGTADAGRERALRSALTTCETLYWRGIGINMLELQMNTVIALGSDPLRLAARIHGQSEVHGWVAGKNRAWMADLIDDGLGLRILRSKLDGTSLGWSGVADLLRSRTDCPVVMSYSTSGAFPSMALAKRAHPDFFDGNDADIWAQMTPDLRWRSALKGIRHVAGLEIRPVDFSTIRFGHGLTVMDIVDYDFEATLDRALGIGGAP